MKNKTAICIIAFFLMCVSAIAQKRVMHVNDYLYLTDKNYGIYIPKNMDEAINMLDTITTIEEKQFIADSLSLEEFCTDLSIGSNIRAIWGFWGSSRFKKYFNDRKVYNPDHMSALVLKAFYELKIKGMNYPAEDIIEPDYDTIPVTPKTSYSAEETKLLMKKGEKLKNDGFAKGDTIYFQYPYGCSTAKEQEIWLEEHDFSLCPKGVIMDVKVEPYNYPMIKVKLISTVSPHGIIVFDGNMAPDNYGDFERDFDNFALHTPNRFYMQVGDELWFDVNFIMGVHYWFSPKKGY